MSDRGEKWYRAAVFAFVLLAMLLFFERAHPLVILDTDDWTYISASRVALPSRRFWNPARIFPEILMPYASGLGALLFHRLGFIPSLTVMNGLVLSLFIAWYILCFYRLLAEKLRLRADGAAMLALLFLLLHFLIFRTELQNNEYLFRAKDVTCVYYYTIPGLLNCGLAMRLAVTGMHRRFLEGERLFTRGLLAVAAYLAVFSNLFESVLLAAFCGVDFLCGCFESGRGDLRSFLRCQAFNLAVVLLWVVSALMEAGGERAEYASALAFFPSVLVCLRSFLFRFSAMNRVFLLLLSVTVCAGIFLAVKERREKDSGFSGLFFRFTALFLLCAAFEIFLCAKVKIDYIMRSDALFVVYAALLVLSVLTVVVLLKRLPFLSVGLPLLLVIVFSLTNTGLRTYMESNDLYAPAQVCTALDNAIIEQVVAAELAGEDEVTVHVFDTGSEDNWPHTLYIGPRIAASLYKYGITQKLMTIQVVRDTAVNESLHVMTELVP